MTNTQWIQNKENTPLDKCGRRIPDCSTQDMCQESQVLMKNCRRFSRTGDVCKPDCTVSTATSRGHRLTYRELPLVQDFLPSNTAGANARGHVAADLTTTVHCKCQNVAGDTACTPTSIIHKLDKQISSQKEIQLSLQHLALSSVLLLVFVFDPQGLRVT